MLYSHSLSHFVLALLIRDTPPCTFFCLLLGFIFVSLVINLSSLQDLLLNVLIYVTNNCLYVVRKTQSYLVLKCFAIGGAYIVDIKDSRQTESKDF